jgi:DNA modification methylase
MVNFETNIIYNKDCMEVLKSLPNESIDLIATDPPYKVMARGNNGYSGGMFKK